MITNWTPNGIPTTVDDPTIDNGGTATVNTIGNVARALRVGNNATGTLTISGGGVLSHTNASFVGALAGSNGTVNITGAGSAWNWTTTTTLQIGGLGTGTATISSGGTLKNVSGTLLLGAGATGDGTLNIQGEGSLVQVNAFQSGQSGKGSLKISTGADMISGASVIGQLASAFTSTATIDGAGSTWTTAALTVGNNATGELKITNGAVVTSGNVIIGNATTTIATSRVTVDGAGSQWTTGGLTVGSRSSAELFANHGATIISSSGIIGGAPAPVLVQLENNSTWNASLTGNSTLTVGNGGTATLNILSGSSAQTSNRLIIGTGANGVGTMVVDNSSFTLLPQATGVQANTTEVGRDVGMGTLIVQNGATVVLNDSTLQMGTRNINAEGTLIVQGAGTSITAVDGGFSVGQNGTGHFKLLDGAVINTGDFLSAGNASAVAGASDSVVDNATWNITGSGTNAPMRLGSNGIATLDLQNGAVVNVADGGAGARMEIALNPGSSGTLTIGGTGATLNVTEIVGGKRDAANGGVIVEGGTATVTFDHTNAGLIFAPQMLGYLSVNQTNSGTTILTADSDYARGTTISAGTLQLGNGGTTGSITGDVVNDARLVFNRNNELIFGGVISGTGTVDQDGSGATILTGTNTYSGMTNINAGALQLGNGGTTGSITADVTNNARLIFNRSNELTYAGVISGPGIVDQNGSGVTILAGLNTYGGATNVNAGTLRAGALNTFSSSSIFNVASAGTLDLASFDQTVAGLNNAGLVALSAGSAVGTTVTTPNYHGANGRIALNSFLDTDGSPSDRLVISGGAATGTTGLLVRNAGGAGNLTFSDGIMVVQAVNGASTSTGAFTLSGRAIAGAYEYLLFQGGRAATGGDPNDQNWYLRNTISTPDEPIVPLIRAEVAVAMAVPPLAVEYGYAMIDTLHERVGEVYPSPNADRQQWFAGAWGRLIGEYGRRDRNNFLNHGSDYDYTISGLQAGLDLWGRERGGTLDKAGLYVGFGRISANVNGEFDLKAGSVDMDGYTLGGYWTHRSGSGWYTDAVLQSTFYDTETKSIHGEKISPNGWGIAASLEGGYAFKFGDGWMIEPQAQLAYQWVSIDQARDSAGLFSYQDWRSLRGRLGVRVAKTWNIGDEKKPRLITGWLRANVWHEFMGNNAMTVASLSGQNPVRFSSPLGGTWGEVGAGVSGQVSDNTTLFATAAYNRSLDNKGRDGWSGRLGYTVKW